MKNTSPDCRKVVRSGATAVTEQGRSDADLVGLLPGHFENGSVPVNGARLHFVTGGQGQPLVLLPGWPQTWWAFHKVMPNLAQHFRVIAVDIRGMGASAKPEDG